MSAVYVYKFEVSTVNGIMTTLGVAGAIGPAWGAVMNSVCNGLNVCVELMFDAAKKGVTVTPATAWRRIAQVCGPFCGVSENSFIQLVGAATLVGISATLFGAALLSAAAVEILLAAIGLFFDALGYAGTERGYLDAQHLVAVDIGKRRRLEMLLEQLYKKQQGARTTLRNLVPR